MDLGANAVCVSWQVHVRVETFFSDVASPML